MEIIHNQFPPNIAQIAPKLNVKDFNAVFTYGDKLYNPTGLPINDDLMAHEETHEIQQAKLGVDQWWSMYLENPTFRLTMEVEAYKAQAKYLKKNYGRDYWRPRINEMVQTLSSSLYGKIISKHDAKEILNG